MIAVDLLDPPAYSLPYDDALAAALAAAGARVRLITSDFVYGERPAATGYRWIEGFYRGASGAPGSRRRSAAKLATHPRDMLAYARAVGTSSASNEPPDVVHFQWLTIPELDLRLLPRTRPVLLTIHDPLRRGRLASVTGRALGARAFERVAAIVVHSQFARDAVIAAHGLAPERVHVIRHGALTARSPAAVAAQLPPELGDPAQLGADRDRARQPVVLCFGLLRPYKGIATLLAAWRHVSAGELWIVGRPMMDLAPLRKTAPPAVRFVTRFVTDAEQAAIFAAADIVVLPYERSERFGFSGVLASALGAGKPIVLTDVGGLREVGELGAAALVPAGDRDALAGTLQRLIDDPPARAQLAAAAETAARDEFSWAAAARQTLALYEQLRVSR